MPRRFRRGRRTEAELEQADRSYKQAQKQAIDDEMPDSPGDLADSLAGMPDEMHRQILAEHFDPASPRVRRDKRKQRLSLARSEWQGGDPRERATDADLTAEGWTAREIAFIHQSTYRVADLDAAIDEQGE